MSDVLKIDIWKLLSNGQKINKGTINPLNDDHKKIILYVTSLNFQFIQIWDHCAKLYSDYRFGKYGDIEVEPTKEQFINHIEKYLKSELHAVVLAMWDKSPYDYIIWELLKPNDNEKV